MVRSLLFDFTFITECILLNFWTLQTIGIGIGIGLGLGIGIGIGIGMRAHKALIVMTLHVLT